MPLTFAMLAAVVPAVLVVLAAVVVRNAGPADGATRRTLLLLEITTLSILVLLSVLQFIQPPDQNQFYWVNALFIPVIFGMVILILIHLPRLGQLTRRDKVIVILLGLAILAIIASYLNEPSTIWMVLPGGLLTLGLAWLIGVRPSRWVWVLPVIVLLCWAVYDDPASTRTTDLAPALSAILGVTMMIAPVLTVAVMALFVYTGLKMLSGPFPALPAGAFRAVRIAGLARLLTALCLLARIVYSTTWASIWDLTSDGMSGLFIIDLAALVAVACGMVMAERAAGWARLAGFAFIFIVSGAVYAGFTAGWRVSFISLTEQRASQIAQALDQYHAREGRYPRELSELSPRDLLFVPAPVMFRGENWCYRAAVDDYHLAAFFHEYFGLPVTLKVYASAGNAAGQPLPCQERLAEMQAKYDWTNLPVIRSGEPTPPPPSAAQLAIPREPLVPVFSTQETLLPGSWSPDGRWWYFRSPVAGQKQVQLVFFDAAESRLCPVDPVLAYNLYSDGAATAWLPDGRLLYLDGSANPPIFTPCQAGAGQLTAPEGVIFTRVSAVAPAGGRVLLQSQTEYWLLQPDQPQFQRIPFVQPPVYQSQSDHAAWNPSGARLAIAHLNSREPKDGITLYLLDPANLQLVYSQVLDLASTQSAPWTEWISPEELLLHGPSALLLLDFHTNPPRQVNVMKDIFNLDLSYPDQVSSMAAIPARAGGGYTLAVWANHPRNQSLYLYQSENRQISVYQPKSEAVLIFPDGQSTRMTRVEFANPAEDVVSLYPLGSDGASPLEIRVDGHIPRGYPQLDVRYLSGTSRLLLSSSNGVSLVGVPGGERIHFWQTGSGSALSPYLILSPDEKTALALVDGTGIFQIPLDR